MGGHAVIDTCTIQNFLNINRFSLFDELKYYLYITIYVEMETRNFDKNTFEKYDLLISNEKIKRVSLTIGDLIEMANIPESKKYSDTELSCIVKAREFGSIALTDDKRAVKFISQYINDCIVKGTKEVLIEGYIEEHLNDVDLVEIQEQLRQHRFNIKENLLYEAAREKMKLSTNR